MFVLARSLSFHHGADYFPRMWEKELALCACPSRRRDARRYLAGYFSEAR